MVELVGGCLCGAVRYRSNKPAVGTAICHCTHCQKQCGGAFSINVAVPVDALTVEGETVDYHDLGDSGGGVIRRFCGKCGSPLISDIAGQPSIRFIKAGTLDNTVDIKPQVQIWCASRQPWVAIDPDLPAFPRGRPRA
jgi:hypothetical protein